MARAQQPKRVQGGQPTKASRRRPPSNPEPLPPPSTEPGLVERYHAMAEELNGRGAMELAVPFYRQAIALLLAEREQFGTLDGAPTVASGAVAAAREVQALAGAVAAATPAALGLMELRRRVAALDQELSEANRLEVAAAVSDLEQRWGEPQAQLLGLRAKLQLLDGELEAARISLEQAHRLDPGCVRLQQNAGAACLACGDAAAAAVLLRPLRAADSGLEGSQRQALLGNLAQAELELGHEAPASACLEELARLDPDALELSRWLPVLEGWIAADQPALTLAVLAPLAAAWGDRTPLLPLLARSHEALGQYREAALLYRELLRPNL